METKIFTLSADFIENNAVVELRYCSVGKHFVSQVVYADGTIDEITNHESALDAINSVVYDFVWNMQDKKEILSDSDNEFIEKVCETRALKVTL